MRCCINLSINTYNKKNLTNKNMGKHSCTLNLTSNKRSYPFWPPRLKSLNLPPKISATCRSLSAAFFYKEGAGDQDVRWNALLFLAETSPRPPPSTSPCAKEIKSSLLYASALYAQIRTQNCQKLSGESGRNPSQPNLQVRIAAPNF